MRYRYRLVTVLFSIFVIATLLPTTAPAQNPHRFVVETVDNASNVGRYASVALDASGNIHLAYWDISADRLKYAVKQHGVWSFENPDPGNAGGDHCDIAVDSQGNPHISFYRFGTANLGYATKSGGLWTIEDVDANTGQYTAIITDSQDKPHISYYDFLNADLKYAAKSGVWTTETVDDTNTVGTYTDIDISNGGVPYISYFDKSEDAVYYANRDGSSWVHNLIGERGDADGGFTQIVLDDQAVPSILYIDEETGGGCPATVRFVAFLGGEETVLDFLGPAALARDAKGGFHLGIGVAHILRDGGLWPVVVVDGVIVNQWAFNDIAVGRFGNPVMVYQNDTNEVIVADARVRLASDPGGATWPVGSEQIVSWIGAGVVDISLSVDGGASYETLVSGVGGQDDRSGSYSFTVPHLPSRFCKIKVERWLPYSPALSDSFFTIETTISLLMLAVSPGPDTGSIITWNTDPGPDDLAGYRLERDRAGARTELVRLTKETKYHDIDGRSGDTYRLFAVNGLGQEFFLGEASDATVPSFDGKLSAWPVPFRSGNLNVSFPTGGPGGVAAPAEVAIYDVAGRQIRTLASGTYATGVERVTWDGRDSHGRLVSSGIYFIRATSGSSTQTKKLVIVR